MKKYILLLPILLMLTSCKVIEIYVYVEREGHMELLIDQRGSDVAAKLKAALK